MGPGPSKSKEVINKVTTTVKNYIDTKIDTTIENNVEQSQVSMSESIIDQAIKQISESRTEVESKILAEASTNMSSRISQRNSIFIQELVVGKGGVFDSTQANRAITSLVNNVKINSYVHFSNEAATQITSEVVASIQDSIAQQMSSKNEADAKSMADQATSLAAKYDNEVSQNKESTADALNNLVSGVTGMLNNLFDNIGGGATSKDSKSNEITNVTETHATVQQAMKMTNNSIIRSHFESLNKMMYSLHQESRIDNIARLAADVIVRNALTSMISQDNEIRVGKVEIKDGGRATMFGANEAAVNMSNEVMQDLSTKLTFSTQSTLKAAATSELARQISSAMENQQAATGTNEAATSMIVDLQSSARATLTEISKDTGVGVEDLVATGASMIKWVGIAVAIIGGIIAIVFLYFMFGSRPPPPQQGGMMNYYQ